jgi:hypothetical protein
VTTSGAIAAEGGGGGDEASKAAVQTVKWARGVQAAFWSWACLTITADPSLLARARRNGKRAGGWELDVTEVGPGSHSGADGFALAAMHGSPAVAGTGLAEPDCWRPSVGGVERGQLAAHMQACVQVLKLG